MFGFKKTDDNIEQKISKKNLFLILSSAVVLLLVMLAVVFVMADDKNAVNAESSIIINEVVSSNSSSLYVPLLGSPDWVEIKNIGDKTVNLLGYTIKKDDDNVYTFEDIDLKPGESKLMLACDSYYDTDYICLGYKLSKNGGELIISDAEENEFLSLELPLLSEDISYAFKDGEYQYCTTPTPGLDNVGKFYESLDTAVSADAYDSVILTEASEDFAEIYNSGDMGICLSLYHISDGAANMDKGKLPSVMLKPGEYFTVGFNNSSEYDSSVDFSISKDEAVYLSTRNSIISSLDTSTLSNGMSTGLNADGKIVFYTEVTPGKENSMNFYESMTPVPMNEASPLHINEIMLKNRMTLIDEDGDRSDWVELYNSSAETVKLSGYYLSDDETNLFKWNLPDEELKAGEYLIIYLSGKDRAYHTDFKVGAGESLILTDMNKLETETVFFKDEARQNDVSYGLKDGKWCYFGKGTPGKANTSHGSEDPFSTQKLDSEGVFITEAYATSNARSGKKDWIELYNAGKTDFDLSKCYLSNDEDNLKLFELSGKIAPGQYKLIYASSKQKLQTDGTANFGLSTAGESLFLTNSEGAVLDYYETGFLRLGVTSGRANGDFTGNRVFFTKATPGEANEGIIGSYLQAPAFSVDGGRYESEISVEISGEGTIRYTLDGSEPTENSNIYSSAIKISENCSLRAVCFMDGRLSSDVTTATYLFDEAHSLPVVCLSLSDADYRSICSATERTGPVIERECFVEYYEEDGTIGTAFPAGIRISGNSTRTYAQKSFNLYLRGAYGQSSVVYPFFDGYSQTEFKSLNLRNSGQDNGICKLSDMYSSLVMRGLNLDYAEGRFAVLYINGKYWGLYDLKENQNSDFLAMKHDADSDSVCLIRRNLGVLNGSNAGIKKVYSMAQSRNMADEKNYNEFIKYVDDDAFIDYILAQSFCGNGDMFNQKLWYTEDFSVRVRPVFYDLDFAFHSAGGSIFGNFFTGDGVASPDGSLTNMYIPTALKKSSIWKEKFLKRASYFVNEHLEGYLELFDDMVAQMDTEMKRHISRWHVPSSYEKWKSNISTMRGYVSKRAETLMRSIKSSFSVSDAEMHELFPNNY